MVLAAAGDPETDGGRRRDHPVCMTGGTSRNLDEAFPDGRKEHAQPRLCDRGQSVKFNPIDLFLLPPHSCNCDAHPRNLIWESDGQGQAIARVDNRLTEDTGAFKRHIKNDAVMPHPWQPAPYPSARERADDRSGDPHTRMFARLEDVSINATVSWLHKFLVNQPTR